MINSGVAPVVEHITAFAANTNLNPFM